MSPDLKYPSAVMTLAVSSGRCLPARHQLRALDGNLTSLPTAHGLLVIQNLHVGVGYGYTNGAGKSGAVHGCNTPKARFPTSHTLRKWGSRFLQPLRATPPCTAHATAQRDTQIGPVDLVKVGVIDQAVE